MSVDRNTLTTREMDRMLSGQSEFGFLPLVAAAGKAVAKTTRNVIVNATATPAAPVAAAVPAAPVEAPASPVIPFLLASTIGLGLGLAAGYMVGHARSA